MRDLEDRIRQVRPQWPAPGPEAEARARAALGLSRPPSPARQWLARSTHALHLAALDVDALVMPEVHVPRVRVLNMRDLGALLCDRALRPPVRALMV